MGNTNGRIYLNSSRQTINNPNDHDTGNHLVHTDTVVFTDTVTAATLNIDIDKFLPRGYSGYLVHETFSVDNLNPYQTVSLGHPDSDPWYLANVPAYLTANPYLEICEQKYTYIFTQTGYSVLNKNNKPVYPNEFADGIFLGEVNFSYPRLVVRELESQFYSYTLEKNSTTSVTRYLDFRDANARMFKFYIERAKALCVGHEEVLPHFMAQFHAFLYTVMFYQWMSNDITEKYNPFPSEDLTTRLSYPYLLLGDLIMLDHYYAIGDGYAFILIAAMHFVRQWARAIWYIDPLVKFHFGYLDVYYQQAALSLQASVEQTYRMDLKQLEHCAILRYYTTRPIIV